jgi:hypothetical protein
VAKELANEARQELSSETQLDLAGVLIRAVLDDPQFVDHADAELILSLDYLEQGLADLRPR